MKNIQQGSALSMFIKKLEKEYVINRFKKENFKLCLIMQLNTTFSSKHAFN